MTKYKKLRANILFLSFEIIGFESIYIYIYISFGKMNDLLFAISPMLLKSNKITYIFIYMHVSKNLLSSLEIWGLLW